MQRAVGGLRVMAPDNEAAGVLAAPWAAAGMTGARRSVSARRRYAPLAIVLLVALLAGLPLLLRMLG